MKVIVALLAVISLVSAEAAFWQRQARSASHEEVRLQLFVKQSNLDVLEQSFWQVSDPDHARYGAFMTHAEVAALVAPKAEDMATVRKWLADADITEMTLSGDGDAVLVKTDVAHAERLLGVRYFDYQHATQQDRRIRRTPDTPALPSAVELHLGATDFPPLLRRRRAGRAAGSAAYDGGAAAAPETTATPGSLTNIVPTGRGHSTIVWVFGITCMDGTAATEAVPCSSHPPALTDVTLEAGDALRNYSMTAAPAHLGGGFYSLELGDVPDYRPLTSWRLAPMFGSTAGVNASAAHVRIVSTPIITPRSLKALYNIPFNARVTDSRVTQSVVEFEQQYFSQQDLDAWLAVMGLPPQQATLVGYNNASNAGGEANLDIQWMVGMAPGAPSWVWSIRANSTAEIDHILTWALQMSAKLAAGKSVPVVNSLSYGMTELNVAKYLGKNYVKRSDVEFQKLAMQGITIIIADGDTGAGDLGAPPMSAPSCATKLNADWPSQSPYVTAVGSTFITPYSKPICYAPVEEGGIDCASEPLGEVTVSVTDGLFWTSGGGFSTITGRAPYQAKAVEAYLASGTPLPPDSFFNRKGRAYPDVVTVGHNCQVVVNGRWAAEDGTSASAPIFAGIVSLLNQARLDAGQPMLGFINPLLYKIHEQQPAAFNDVVWGHNKCGAIDNPGADMECCPYGYIAAPGWDAASGLGTPNFPVLRDMAIKLGPPHMKFEDDGGFWTVLILLVLAVIWLGIWAVVQRSRTNALLNQDENYLSIDETKLVSPGVPARRMH